MYAMRLLKNYLTQDHIPECSGMITGNRSHVQPASSTQVIGIQTSATLSKDIIKQGSLLGI